MKFVEGVRHLYVYGHSTPDTVTEVYADEKLLPAPPEESKFYPHDASIGKIIFGFQTAAAILGSVKIKIKVFQGKVKLTRTRVKYPARFLNNMEQISLGYSFMYQPIADPKFHVKLNSKLFTKTDDANQGEWHHQLEAGDEMEYHHLMLEGQNCRYISCNGYALDKHSLLYFDDTDKSFFSQNKKLDFVFYKELLAHERLEVYKKGLAQTIHG